VQGSRNYYTVIPQAGHHELPAGDNDAGVSSGVVEESGFTVEAETEEAAMAEGARRVSLTFNLEAAVAKHRGAAVATARAATATAALTGADTTEAAAKQGNFVYSPLSTCSDSFKSRAQSKSLRILVVDDALPILKITSKALQMKGHKVETAQNGKIAYDRLVKMLNQRSCSWGSCKDDREPTGFDVVLMDLQMPVMDGIEATRKFREFEDDIHARHAKRVREEAEDVGDAEGVGGAEAGEGWRAKAKPAVVIDTLVPTVCEEWRRRLVIIGASANSDSENKQQALYAGMNAFVAKPYSYNDLVPVFISEGLMG
jgi:CheY-like chemotaxis protein